MKIGFIWLGALCVAIPAMVVAQSAEKKTLVGVWEAKISPKDAPPPLLSIAIFGGDGSFTTSVNATFPPVPPFQGFADELGPGYGRWLQTGDREFTLTFYAVLRKEGVVNGYQRIHSTLILSESGNEFTVHDGQVDFLDAHWNVVSSNTDEVTGKRLETP
jgi:hypothetical protein